MGYLWPMRLHIVLDESVVAELDRRVGPRQCSAFITRLIQRGPEDEQRWDEVQATLGQIADTGHDWDEDPASWVSSQRHGDPRRVG